MTLRKRRQPTPDFRLLPPYQPITGERAPLLAPGVHPYCAMMQVAVADTHDNYVICRGYDTRVKKFFDYEEGDEDKVGIAVAKPYSKRFARVYRVADIFPAVLPLMRLGQNPGVAADSQGQPADLDEEIEILYDANEKVINWLLLDGGGQPVWFFELDEELPQWDWGPEGTYTPRDAWPRDWDPSAHDGVGGFVPDCTATFPVGDVENAGFFGQKGANGWAEIRPNETEEGFIGVIRGLNCPDDCVCGEDWTEDPSCEDP